MGATRMLHVSEYVMHVCACECVMYVVREHTSVQLIMYLCVYACRGVHVREYKCVCECMIIMSPAVSIKPLAPFENKCVCVYDRSLPF